MDKYDARIYMADFESRIEEALKKWKHITKIENGGSTQFEWQFEDARIIVDVFWGMNKDRIKLTCYSPTIDWKHEWDGLTKETTTKAMDRIGNFAQIIQSKHHK